MYVYKKREEEEKKRSYICESVFSHLYMKKEKKRKRCCSSFLLGAPSSTSKKPFLNLPLLYKKREERKRSLACTRTKERKKENRSTRRREERERKRAITKTNERERGHDDEQKHTRHPWTGLDHCIYAYLLETMAYFLWQIVSLFRIWICNKHHRHLHHLLKIIKFYPCQQRRQSPMYQHRMILIIPQFYSKRN